MNVDKKEHIHGYSYETILKALKAILSIDSLRKVIIVSGGIVPWIVSGEDSGRLHSDIDIVCKQKDMECVRKTIKELNLYIESMDSLNYHYDGLDYGLYTIIADVPIGFFPYNLDSQINVDTAPWIGSKMMVFRTFTPPIILSEYTGKHEDKPEFKIKYLPQLSESDLCSESYFDGIPFTHMSLELIRASKTRSMKSSWRKEKDLKDIEMIDRMGVDLKKQKRLNNLIAHLKST